MKWLRRVRDFFLYGIWERDLDSSSFATRAVFYPVRAVTLVVRGMTSHRLSIWASSLTYLTLISVVPFVALLSGVLAKLGAPMKVVDLFTQEMPEAQVQQFSNAAKAFEDFDFRTVGVVSILLLVYAAVKVLLRIEKAFNEIWGVTRDRGTLRRLGIYSAVVVFAPFLLLAALVLTGTIFSSGVLEWFRVLPFSRYLETYLVRFLPLLASWVALTLLYWLVPFTRVRFRAALLGGLFGAILGQIAQQLFIQAGVGVARISVVYGAFAAIPIFLIYVYLNWVVIFLGMEFAYGAQHAKEWFRTVDEEQAFDGWRAQDTALRTALWLGEREGSHDPDAIAEEFGVPARLVTHILDVLTEEGICEFDEEEEGYRLVLAPEEIEAEDVVQPFRIGELRSAGSDAVAELRERARSPYRIPLSTLYERTPR